MPQASSELHDKMREYFGDDYISDVHASQYLEEHGYKEDRFQWHPKEGVKTYDDMTEKEWHCLKFLIDEWDWGGFVNEQA